jgi:hypothetical protein
MWTGARGGVWWRVLSVVAGVVVMSPRIGNASGDDVPKVPFGNQPCQSLSAADQATLQFPGTLTGRPDRAPATLPYDNVCTWDHGGTRYVQIGYQAKIDYDANRGGNQSTSHQAPTDLPGAFYDRQGGLWFTKNGYFVVVSGKSKLREPVAKILAAKL